MLVHAENYLDDWYFAGSSQFTVLAEESVSNYVKA